LSARFDWSRIHSWLLLKTVWPLVKAENFDTSHLGSTSSGTDFYIGCCQL
jgi:hypothetical protein